MQSLNKDEKYQYLVKSKKCFDAETLITKSYTKSNKTFNLLYKKSWLDQYSWHVYSPHLNGGLCNVCVVFDDPDVKNRGIFVKKAFQDRSKPEKVKEHNNLQYHQAAVLKAEKFQENYEGVSHGVDYDSNKEFKFKENQHILQQTIEAVLLCGEQGIPLRGHREQDINYIDEIRQRPPNQGNFIAIIKAFAKYDEKLRNHFLTGPRNAQYLSPQIQNDIIGSISEFVRDRIRGTLNDHVYCSVIADEVTDRHGNKEIILVCLRFLQTIGKKVIVQESFLDSNHMSGRATGKYIAEHIINILKKHEININNCRGQAYDGATIMSSDIKGAQSYIKKIEPKAAYAHCRNHVLNLAIANVCQNASIKRFMTSLTEACSFLRHLA